MLENVLFSQPDWGIWIALTIRNGRKKIRSSGRNQKDLQEDGDLAIKSDDGISITIVICSNWKWWIAQSPKISMVSVKMVFENTMDLWGSSDVDMGNHPINGLAFLQGIRGWNKDNPTHPTWDFTKTGLIGREYNILTAIVALTNKWNFNHINGRGFSNHGDAINMSLNLQETMFYPRKSGSFTSITKHVNESNHFGYVEVRGIRFVSGPVGNCPKISEQILCTSGFRC